MTQTVSISEFKAKCLALVDMVKKTGQPLLITKRGEPIAQVVPPPEGQANALAWVHARYRNHHWRRHIPGKR